jgi:hypothetical protein
MVIMPWTSIPMDPMVEPWFIHNIYRDRNQNQNHSNPNHNNTKTDFPGFLLFLHFFKEENYSTIDFTDRTTLSPKNMKSVQSFGHM